MEHPFIGVAFVLIQESSSVDPYNLFYYYCFSCGWNFIIIAQRTTLLRPEIIYLFHLNGQSNSKIYLG